MWDVAVIGAGLSGITCARRLASAGYSVCVLDKSRGVGGRIATRRVNAQTRVDHGLRYWQPMSEELQALTNELVKAGVLKRWAASEYEIRQRGALTRIEANAQTSPKYVAKAGMSAVAKFLLQQPEAAGAIALSQGQNLLTGHRAVAVSHQAGHWIIKCEGGAAIAAKRCAIALPAQQAADLLEGNLRESESASQNFTEALEAGLDRLKAVRYFPCLTVMAGYAQDCSSKMGELDPEGWMVTDYVGTSTDWVGLDSSKRDRATAPEHSAKSGPVIVIHSKPKFARRYLEARDLQPAASVLLRASARKFADWIAQPNWFQIHRWRYAQVKTPHPEVALVITDTLACGGDWCVEKGTSDRVASIDCAYRSGLAMAVHLQQ